MNRFYAFLSKIAVTFVLIIVSFQGLGLAETPSGTLHLDLSTPPSKQTEKEDPILEKYNEVMSEIAISDEAAQIVDNIKDKIQGINSVCMDVSISEIRGQRIEKVDIYLLASLEHEIARIEFLEPSAMRGQILVAEQQKMEVRVYQPVNNQIAVRGLEDASKEVLSTLSIADLTNFFDFSQYTVEVLETTEAEGISTYLLQVEAEDEIWHVAVQSDSWFPHEIAVIKGEVPGTMVISNVVFDPEPTVEELVNLPKAKEVRM